jgi:hypothetical protein
MLQLSLWVMMVTLNLLTFASGLHGPLIEAASSTTRITTPNQCGLDRR